MNKVLIVDASESDRRLMSGLLVKHGYEPISVDNMEAAKEEVAKLPPGAVVVTAMKFAHGTAQKLANWQKRISFTVLVNDNRKIPMRSEAQGLRITQRLTCCQSP